MKKIKWGLFLLVIILLLIIVFRNLEETNVELIVTTVKLPLAALLSVTLLVGFALGLFSTFLWKFQSWRASHSKVKHETTGHVEKNAS